MPDPLWISEREAAELLSLEDAIDVLANTYRLAGAGGAASMRRAHLREGPAILHAVGGTIASAGVTGTKTWTYTPGGASPLLILFAVDDGRVLGIVEAFAMGQMRTAATTGLGTRVLAREDSDTLALLGTGKQAFEQAHAVCCVRPIRAVRLFGRDPGRRTSLAARISEELAVEVSEHADHAAAMAGADIVTAITRAADPFITAADISDGQHLNAVGAIVPVRRELDHTAVSRAAVVVADSADQAREDSGEIAAAVERGGLRWSAVRDLSEVVDAAPGTLRSAADVTLFKALGVGLSDVALGAEILRRAQSEGAGMSLPVTAHAHHH